ncbi:MAG: hypothetical protein LBU57_04300 [Dysgonamonadaceae bacterium]|jgi:hypothetical protein|nr:hypothetical protein [Dysgonamonadaceae bacterium]
MNNNQDNIYNVPESAEFFHDCLQHSVCSRIDMIADDSWRRVLSDKTVQWMFDNFDQARQLVFSQKNHVMTSENERWRGKITHLEAGFTIRTNNTDYIFQIELDNDFLEYFRKKYGLNTK